MSAGVSQTPTYTVDGAVIRSNTLDPTCLGGLLERHLAMASAVVASWGSEPFNVSEKRKSGGDRITLLGVFAGISAEVVERARSFPHTNALPPP